MRLSGTRCALLFLVATLGHAGAWSQTTSSLLRGTVRGQEKRPAPQAVVEAHSESTGVVRTATSDKAGRFSIDLPPGTWTVVARGAEGMTSESRTLAVRLQETVVLDLTLGKGLTEQVRVTVESAPIDPQRVGVDLRVGKAQMNAIPVAGRMVTDLPLIDSAVRAAPAAGFLGERGAVFIVNGQSGRSNSFLVDGLDNNDRTSSTTMNAFFSELVVRELVVNTSRYAAEFGTASGAIFNIVTEQGGNVPTGELFLQGAPAGLNQAGEFVDSLPSRSGSEGVGSRYGLGFKLGGAFREDKAFYLAAYERARENRIASYVGVGRDAAPGGWVVAPGADDNFFLRTDFNLSSSQYLMIRLSADRRETDGLNVGGTVTPEAGFRLDEKDLQLAASLTSVLSPQVLNEARFLAGTSTFDQFANSDRPGVERPSGSFGGNYLNRQLRGEDKAQLVENLTWRTGPHTLKFGFDLTRTRTDIQTQFNPNGNFLYTTDAPYNPGDCGVFFWQVSQAIDEGTYPVIPCPPWAEGRSADIGTYPLFYQLIFGKPAARLDDTQIALFAQDALQVHPNLLLDFGLRYDLSTFELPAYARVKSPIPNGGARSDKNNIAPRLAFTYTPGSDSRFVLRGGGGIFYDKIPMAFPAVSSVMSGTEIRILPAQGLTMELNEDLIEAGGGGEVIGPLFPFPEDLILRFSTGTRLDTPYTVQTSLGMERGVGRGGAVLVELTRALGYHVPVMRDLNPVTGFESCAGPDPAHPDKKYLYTCTPVHGRDGSNGSIAAIVTEGRSWYSGLQAGWRWTGPSGWHSVSYTWSKATDLGPDPLKGGIYLPPDSDHLEEEKGPSDGDVRHRFALSGETALPWMGLRVSGLIQYSTAPPFNVYTGYDDNLDGITTDRLPGIGRNSGVDTPLARVNELRAQENEMRGLRKQPALAPIGSLHASAFFQVDLRVSKPFSLGRGKSQAEVFVEVFNLLDRFNGGPVEGRVNSPNFGQPLGQIGSPRTVELGARVTF